MSVDKANDLVLSGNYHNVWPDGSGSIRGPFAHVGFSSGGTGCIRLGISGGANIRVGGASAAERNLFGNDCSSLNIQPTTEIRNLLIAGNYFGLDRTGSRSLTPERGSTPGCG